MDVGTEYGSLDGMVFAYSDGIELGILVLTNE